MRIRFRAPDFGLVDKINSPVQNRNRRLVRRGCSGHSFFCLQLGFWTQKMQANVGYCYVRRRAERTSLGRELEHLSLRSDSSLAAKRRAEALHVVFFSTKHPSPARQLLLCAYSRMIRSHKRRALGALLSLFSRSEPASTNS